MSSSKIPFNKPYLSGKEFDYMRQAVDSGHISGNGQFTKQCQSFFEQRYGFGRCLLTSSCTDALEMAALLIKVAPDDEIILPSYTFVSTANPFVLRGCKLIFADSSHEHPNLDANVIQQLITTKTKAIVVVHYGGVACDMDKIMALANKHGIFVIEDAAQSIESFHNGKPLGGIGHLSSFSFHETKNIVSGEGGMLVINDLTLEKRAEILWEKGTNRSAFFRGEVDKYGWVDVGSSFLPSEIISAFLLAQMEMLDTIQQRRISIWNTYWNELKDLHEKEYVQLTTIPPYASNNGHLFAVVAPSLEIRTKLLSFLSDRDIKAVFHYQSLHKSNFFREKHDGRELIYADRYTDCLLRLPLFFELTPDQQAHVIHSVRKFFV